MAYRPCYLLFLVFFVYMVGGVSSLEARYIEQAVECLPESAWGLDPDQAIAEARALDRAGKYAEALAQYHNALLCLQQARKRAREADVTSDLAVVYRKLGKVEQSLKLQQQAAQMYAELGNPSGQAKALRRLGVLYRHEGKLFEAISFYQDALSLLSRMNDQEGIAQVLTNLGIVYGELGRLKDAQQYFQRALGMYTALEIQGGISYSLGNLGQLSLYLGESQDALNYLTQSLDMKRALADSRGKANTLLNMGTAYKNLGDFQKALTLYYQTLDAYTALNDQPGQAAVLGSIGSVYEKLGKLEPAWEYQQKSLRFKKLSGTPNQLSIALTNLASLAIQQQRFSEADAYLQEALTIAIAHDSILGQANIYGQLGVQSLARNDFPQALNYFARSLALYERMGAQKGVLEALTFIGQAHIKQACDAEALPYFQRALQLSRELNDIDSLWAVQYRLGKIFLNTGQTDEAFSYFHTAVQTLEQMRSYLHVPELRRSFLQKDLNPYMQIIRLLLKQGKHADALWYLERFKARTFLEVVAYGEPQLHQVPTLVQEEQYLSARIRFLNKRLSAPLTAIHPESQIPDDVKQELFEAKKHYEQLLLRVKLQYPEYYRLKNVDAEELRNLMQRAMGLLDDNVAILEYFLDEDAVHIWVIERERIHYASSPVAHQAILERVLQFRAELARYDSNEIWQPLHELYTWLVRPVEKYLTQKEIVGIVPFQMLYFVPFGALVRSRESGEIPEYFIQRHAVFMLPSLSMLPIVRDRTERNARHAQEQPMQYLLGMANATEDLPGAEEEIRSISQQFPNSQAFIGNDATKERLLEKAGDYEILHLATHSVFDKQHPMFSYVEFASEGYLYAREIFGLQLWCSLVTLSGCETLLPQQFDATTLHTLVSGDELVGFIRAFLYAGTPSVLASLWRVNDTATQYLMHAFYQKLPGLGKAKALQHAGQTVMHSTLSIGRRKKQEIRLFHPFFWSSFVLIGDWK